MKRQSIVIFFATLASACSQQFDLAVRGQNLDGSTGAQDMSAVEPVNPNPFSLPSPNPPPGDMGSIDVEVDPDSPNYDPDSPNYNPDQPMNPAPSASASSAPPAPAPMASASPPSANPPRVVDPVGNDYCRVPPPANGSPAQLRDHPKKKKILICHKPAGMAQKNKLIPQPAWHGHGIHGDHLGACDQSQPVRPADVVYDDCE